MQRPFRYGLQQRPERGGREPRPQCGRSIQYVTCRSPSDPYTPALPTTSPSASTVLITTVRLSRIRAQWASNAGRSPGFSLVNAAVRTDSGSDMYAKKSGRSLSRTSRSVTSGAPTGQSLRVASVSRSRASNSASLTICSCAGVSRATEPSS